MNLTIKEIEQLCDIEKPQLEIHPVLGVYYLRYSFKNGKAGFLRSARSDSPRKFKTVDASYQLVRSIFKSDVCLLVR